MAQSYQTSVLLNYLMPSKGKSFIQSCFYTLFFLTPLLLWPYTSEVFEFNKMMFVYAMTVVIGAAWAIRSIQDKKFEFARTPFDIPILLFLSSQIASTIFSIDRHTSLWGYYSRFHGGLASTLCYILLFYALVTHFSGQAKAVKKLIYTILATATLTALYAVLERMGIDKNIWVQDVQNRVFSTMGQPNWLSAYLIALLPLSLFGLINSKNIYPRFLYGFLSFLFLMAILFTRSQSGIGATADERNGVYTGENIETAVSLRTNANAIVSIPHTESRSLDLLRSVKPDVIEIINIHASIDPKIRGQYLRQDYFEGIIDMVVNWIDPYSEQEPDLAFLAFLNFSPVYFEKWNTLLNEGMHIAPIAATDSHQNALTWTDRYDERLDSHRRLGRWLSNHYLLLGDDPGHVKSAVKYGRGWIVMEGLGTPVGMDFYAETAGGGYTNPGESVTLVPGKTFLKVKLPWLHPDSPSSGDLPEIKILLRKIVSDGSEAIVARTTNEDLTWEVKDRGIYRAEVTILPQHLKGFLNYKKDDYMRETTWIITNNIFVE